MIRGPTGYRKVTERRAHQPQQDRYRRGATTPAAATSRQQLLPAGPFPVVRSPHAPVIRDGGGTAPDPTQARQSADPAQEATPPPPLAVFGYLVPAAVGIAPGHACHVTVAVPERRSTDQARAQLPINPSRRRVGRRPGWSGAQTGAQARAPGRARRACAAGALMR